MGSGCDIDLLTRFMTTCFTRLPYIRGRASHKSHSPLILENNTWTQMQRLCLSNPPLHALSYILPLSEYRKLIDETLIFPLSNLTLEALEHLRERKQRRWWTTVEEEVKFWNLKPKSPLNTLIKVKRSFIQRSSIAVAIS